MGKFFPVRPYLVRRDFVVVDRMVDHRPRHIHHVHHRNGQIAIGSLQVLCGLERGCGCTSQQIRGMHQRFLAAEMAFDIEKTFVRLGF